MNLSPNETVFLLWVCAALLALIAFIAILFINTFLQMGKDISEIKTELKVGATKHEDFERRISHLELIKNRN